MLLAGDRAQRIARQVAAFFHQVDAGFAVGLTGCFTLPEKRFVLHDAAFAHHRKIVPGAPGRDGFVMFFNVMTPEQRLIRIALGGFH